MPPTPAPPRPRATAPARIRRDLDNPDFPGDAPLANAVARICLNAIRSRLPDWSGYGADGALVSERAPQPPRAARVVALPRLLLTIDWADSAPGFSWPEAYHATYLPEFRRHVVTVSVDCAETWGAFDFAIGVVREREDFHRRCGAVLRAWWRHQRDCDQAPWHSVLQAGVVDEETARAWRLRTWSAERCAEEA
jgi:hypothetical protein